MRQCRKLPHPNCVRFLAGRFPPLPLGEGRVRVSCSTTKIIYAESVCVNVGFANRGYAREDLAIGFTQYKLQDLKPWSFYLLMQSFITGKCVRVQATCTAGSGRLRPGCCCCSRQPTSVRPNSRGRRDQIQLFH